MSVDPYSPCQGGTGKKVKFCCADLLGDLEKLQRMIEGDQRQGCIDQISKLEQKFEDRACLFGIKALVQIQLGHVVEARETVDRFLTSHPENPLALAEQALLTASEEGIAAALPWLHRAAQACPERPPDNYLDLLYGLATLLVNEGKFHAARALARRIKSMRSDNETADRFIAELNQTQAIPLFVKDDYDLEPPPEGAAYADRFNQALREADQGFWTASAQHFEEISDEASEAPELWWNLSVLRLWLADEQGAAESLRKFSALDVPLEDAAEAEALALWLDQEPSAGGIEEIALHYPVRDMESLLARLTAHQKTVDRPVPQPDPKSDEPAAKAAFGILDRDAPDSGAQFTIEQVPLVLGSVAVYGRQTDREAQLLLASSGRENLIAATALLEEIAGECLGDKSTEDVITTSDAVDVGLRTDWAIPPGTSHEHLEGLIDHHVSTFVFEVWPDMAQQALDGKTPLEAASDSQYRVRLLALVLDLAMRSALAAKAIDFDRLRAKLDLPAIAEVSIREYDELVDVPLTELGRIKLEELSDEDLLALNDRAIAFGARDAIRRFAAEMLTRPEFAGAETQQQLYRLLFRLALDSGDALRYLEQGRKAAEDAGQSSASWDLQEMELRVVRTEPEEFRRLLMHVQTEHIEEPGVREALSRLLMSMGLIGQDGRPTAAVQSLQPAAQEAAQPATPEAGKLWTPGGETSTSGKSSLWTPGDD